MKKKFFSFLVALVLVLPIFFVTGCKTQEVARANNFTFSILLKNAKNKIDENSLLGEYDVVLGREVAWTNSGSDFTLCVKRTGTFSSTTTISLVEGVNYSNLAFKINNQNSEPSIKSSGNDDCAANVFMAGRFFEHKFINMKSNTEVVIDFSDCSMAQISLNVSALRAKNAQYVEVPDGFLTIGAARDLVEIPIESDELVLDYGQMVAFDCEKPLVFVDSNNNETALNASTYGSKHWVNANIMQYMQVRANGTLVLGGEAAADTTIRTVKTFDYDGMRVATSVDNLQSGQYLISTNSCSEIYDSHSIEFVTYTGEQFYFELTGDALDYYYYLTENIDDEFTMYNEMYLYHYTDGESVEHTYLQVDFSEDQSARYLMRRAKFEDQYFYAVAIDVMPDKTDIVNASYVIFGDANQGEMTPDAMTGKVIYYIKKTEQMQVRFSPTSVNPSTNVVVKNESVELHINVWDAGFEGEILDERTFNDNIGSDYEVKEVEIFSIYDSTPLYSITVTYSQLPGEYPSVILDFAGVLETLNEGESIYIARGNPTTGWKKLTEDTITLAVNNSQSGMIFYYIVSERFDSLKIMNNEDEISRTGECVDCCGRQLNANIEVNGVHIDTTKIQYLELNTSDNSIESANLVVA